jgi:hypothetical protein
VGEFLKLLTLVEVDVELRQAVEDELALVDEDLHLVPQELLAVLLHFLGHGGAEHHDLLVVGSLHEDVLHVCPHLRVAQHLIALVHHEELASLQLDQLVLHQVVQPAGSCNDDVGSSKRVFQLILVFL